MHRELADGRLDNATKQAKAYQQATGQPIPLSTAVEMLPLVLAQHPDQYERWALGSCTAGSTGMT